MPDSPTTASAATPLYREHAFGPPLDRFVECVWSLSAPRRPPGLPAERITPDGCVEIIVQLAARARAAPPLRPMALQPAAFILAPLAGPLRLEPSGAMRTLGIRFRPGGAAPFLPFAIDALGPGEVPLDAAFGRAGGELVERLAAAPSEAARTTLVEAFLLGRLAERESGKRTGDPGDRAVAAAVRRILAGRFSVAALARDCGWSVRQLERRFRRDTGLAPRALGRIVRFQRVLRAVSPGRERADWVRVALDCGYSDQPHLIRDFRELAGETPATFLRPDSRVARIFVAPERLARFFAG